MTSRRKLTASFAAVLAAAGIGLTSGAPAHAAGPPPLPLATGPLFGQDGVRVTGGASVEMTGDTVSSNLVNGTDSPIQSVYAPTPDNDPYPLGDHAENNQNLRLAAGVRLVGAGSSSITDSNITDNAFGVLNTTSDGTTPNTATPVTATNDWWGLRAGTVSLPNPGPAVWTDIASPSAATYNPPVPENPVNGSPVADPACPSGVQDSTAVTFCPYRDSDQADSVSGELPIPDAPPGDRAGRLHERRPARPEHSHLRLVLRDDAGKRYHR